MAAPSEEHDMETALLADSIMSDTEETLSPSQTATRTNIKAEEMKDISIRYEIPVQMGQSIEDHLELHNQLLQVLTAAFDNKNLHILDKKYQQVQNFDDSRWMDKDYYDSHFNHHVDISERMTVIDHSIRSTQTLFTIKQDIAIASFLQTTNTSLCDPRKGFQYKKKKTKHTPANDQTQLQSQEEEEDNHSEATVPSGRPPEIIEAELIEIFIRYEITIKNRDTDRGPHLRHATVLKEMFNAFPEEELQIINNRNKRVQPHNYQKWSDSKYYEKNYDIYTLPGKGSRPVRHYIVHRLRTTLSLSTIKNERRVFQALQENDVFLTRHYFQEDEWNTVNLGFMLFFDPSKHTREDAKERVLNVALEEDSYEKGKGDKFQMVAGTPFLYVGGRRFPTQAYTVVCLRENASDVDTMLKNTYRKTSHYVKFRLRNRNAQAFGRALQAQNHYLSTLRTIPIVGLTTDMMKELEDKFLALEGIGDIVRCPQTETIGRWNILTNEEYFFQVIKDIKLNLKPWLDEIFHGKYDRPDEFPEIRVTARVADDDSSVGDCSYLSTSAISYGSFETTGSYDQTQNDHNSSTRSSRPTSYADAINTGSSHTNRTPRNFVAANQSSISAMSSPATIPYEVQQKLQELEAKLSKFQDLEAKMDRLQQVMEALLTVSSPAQAEPKPSSNNRPDMKTKQTKPYEPEDPRPEEQYIPSTPNSVVLLHTPQRANIGEKSPHGGMQYISPASTIAQAKTSAKHNTSEPKQTILQQTANKTMGTANPSSRSLGGVIKLWTDPNKVNNPDPVFDEWKLVEKRGKRNAETSNSVESKRSDKRDTPTRMKRQAGLGRKTLGSSHKPRPAKPVDDIPKPHAIKKKLIFHNPYRNPKKQVDHKAICANRPLTWQQRLNVPPNWGDDEHMEESSSSRQQPLPPSPPSPYSPPRKFPAVETTQRF